MGGKKLVFFISAMLLFTIGSFTVKTVNINRATENFADALFVEGEIIVGLKENIQIIHLKVDQPDPILGLKIKTVNAKLNFIVVECQKQKEEYYISLYRSSNLVEYAEKNNILKLNYVPNDPAWDRQWGPKNIKCEQAWDVTKGSKDVVVAIVDSGIDYNHPDLKANMWRNSQGYYGYDFIEDDNYPMDELGHGTHCAGIVAAVMDNQGIAGVAQVSIMSVRVVDKYGKTDGVTSLTDGIVYAADEGADIISMSLGSYVFLNSLKDACEYAWNKGVIIFASAGNDNVNWNHYPSDYPDVVSVAASNNKNEKAYFSNWGSNVDIVAPGEGIYSTFLNNEYKYLSGTSMACPHAAGVAALAKSKNPTWTNQQIRQKIYESADPIGNEGTLWKYGKVDATLDGQNNYVAPNVYLDIFKISNDGAGLDPIDIDLNPEWFYEVTFENDQKKEIFMNYNFKASPAVVEGEYLNYYVESYQSEVSNTNTWLVGATHVFQTTSFIVTVKIKLMEDDFIFDWFSDIADISSRKNPGGDYEFGWDERGRVFTAQYDIVSNSIIKETSDRYEEENGWLYTRGDWDGSTHMELFDWKQDDACLWFKISDDYNGVVANAGGPYYGKIDESIEFIGTAQDGTEPYFFEWDLNNDNVFEQAGQKVSHSWSKPGEHLIKLKVTDGFGQSDTAETTVTIAKNNAPEKPKISGPTNGKPNQEYIYEISSVDFEQDAVSFFIDWGDETSSGWTDFVESGSSISVSHEWESKGAYLIKAKAKDIHGEESNWSLLPVKMPRIQNDRVLSARLFDRLSILKISENNKQTNIVILITKILEKI